MENKLKKPIQKKYKEELPPLLFLDKLLKRSLIEMMEEVEIKKIEYNKCKRKIRTRLKYLLPLLSDKEQTIISMRFGLEDGINHTLGEVGRELCVTRERIRVIEKEIFDKLNIKLW